MKYSLSLLLFCGMLTFFHTPYAQALSTSNKSSSAKTIKLYTYPKCPHCHSVINFLKKKGWHDRVVIINADEEENYKELKRLRNDGKDYCPFLVDEVHNKNMGESKNIIQYFKDIFNQADDAI